MIKELAQSDGATIAIEITGKITLEEEQKWLDMFDDRINQYEKISVMLILGKNTSWGTKSGYEDIKWLVKNFKKFNKIAIVTESAVWKWLITVDSAFAKLVGVNEKHFDATEAKKAWEWVVSTE